MLPAKMAKFEEEAKISRLLFGNSENLLENCSKDKQIELDEADDEDSSLKRKNKHKIAWHDEDDDEINIGTALEAQGRRLPKGGKNDHSKQYSDYLKNKFAAMIGTPDWANLDNQEGYNSDDDILQRVGHITKSGSSYLKKGIIAHKKVKHLNSSTFLKEKLIKVVEFHSKSSVALVAGTAGILSLLTVNGRNNEKLHCVSFKKYPIICGHFTPDGEHAYLGSNLPHYFVYDLMNAKALRIPLPHNITKMTMFEISPCGKYLAIAGRFGEIHILCAKSKEQIKTLKQEGDVKAMCFNSDTSKLFAHSSNGTVSVWDMKSLRVTHCWMDDGCISGSAITISPSNEYFATGSDQGIVNIYETKDTLSSKNPKPKKILSNLTTKISGLRFNPQSEILGFYSSDYTNAIRLAHIPSFQVFSNFPTYPADYGYCTTLNFSPNSGYMSFGTTKRFAHLYRLTHYKNY